MVDLKQIIEIDISCWKRCELILNGWDLDTPTRFFLSKRMIFRSQHCAFETFQYTSVQSLREERSALRGNIWNMSQNLKGNTIYRNETFQRLYRNYTPKKYQKSQHKFAKNTSNTTYNQQTFCCFKGYYHGTTCCGVGQRLQTLKALPPEQLKQIIDELGGLKNPKKKQRRMSNLLGW